MFNVHDSHEIALQWQLNSDPAQRYITRLQELLAEVDGRSVATPQARWARGLLKVELAAAKKHLATITKAAAEVEPYREALRAALALVEQARATRESATTAEALVLASADFSIKSRAIVAPRAAFDQAVAAVSSHASECTIGDVQRVHRDHDWGTFYLIDHANEPTRYQPGYGSALYDATKKMGCDASTAEMVGWITQETEFREDSKCAEAFALRFEWFCRKQGIAIEQPAAAE